jgi:hypothetical protein
MSDDDNLTDEQIADAVNQSGFPLQLGLQRLVERSQRWQVGLVEHAWTDPLSGDPKFIDLVAIGKDRPWRLVIEAKRSRNTAWLFLTGKHGANLKFDVQARAVSTEPPVDDWERTYFLPNSPAAAFCIVRKNNQYSQELIEKTAAELVRAADALAAQETAISARERIRAGQPSSLLLGRPDGVPSTRLYFPVIVTTAKLYAAFGNYDETNLVDGDLPDITGEEVPLVRLTKSLSVPQAGAPGIRRNGTIQNLGSAAQRTVLVVQAQHFTELLESWQLKLDSAQSWLINCNLLS